MQEKLYNMLMQKDEITWQTIIYDLIKSEQMNPWDIDISLLAKRYIETIKEMQEANFFISGKILLAASLLLRIKSHKLVSEDIADFDSLLYPAEDVDLLEDLEDIQEYRDVKIPKLALKTPQSRKRKVTVNDLMIALNKALEVNKRKVLRRIEERRVPDIKIPEKKVDITELIKNIYERILQFFKKKEKVTFTELVGSDKKEDKVFTFIPLLHLDNEGKINLQQEKAFSEIEITK